MRISKSFCLLLIPLLIYISNFHVTLANAGDFRGNDIVYANINDSLDVDLWTAFHLRPEVQDINTRVNVAFESLCRLESETPKDFPLSMIEATEEISPEQMQDDKDLNLLLCSPFPLYTPAIAQTGPDEPHGQLLALLAEQTELFRSIRLQVLQARIILEALKKQEDAAHQDLQQAEEDARMSLDRQRQFVAQPYEVERTQIAIVEEQAKLNRIRGEILKAQKALDCATGKIPCHE